MYQTTEKPKTNQDELQDLVRRIAESLTGTSFNDVDEDEIRAQVDRDLQEEWLTDGDDDTEEPEATEQQYREAIDAAEDSHMEAYDIHVTASSNGQILGYRIMVAGGGPTAWIHTADATVYGYWGGCTPAQWGFSYDIAREIEDNFDGIFDGVTLSTS